MSQPTTPYVAAPTLVYSGSQLPSNPAYQSLTTTNAITPVAMVLQGLDVKMELHEACPGHQLITKYDTRLLRVIGPLKRIVVFIQSHVEIPGCRSYATYNPSDPNSNGLYWCPKSYLEHFHHDKDIFFITGSKAVSKLLAKTNIHNEVAKLFVKYKTSKINLKPIYGAATKMLINGASLFIK